MRVITELKNDKGKEQLPRFFMRDKNFYLMHNKFCVVDHRLLITGSMNPTTNDALRNHNNLLIIDSPILSSFFEAEFEEMYHGTYGGGGPTSLPIIRNGYAWQVYFCPEERCQETILARLEEASHIDAMVFAFTDEQIALRLAAIGNASRVVWERRQSRQKTSVKKTLDRFGVLVKEDNTSATLHHKVFIIDNTSVFFGSYNPTRAGNEWNDEALLWTNETAVVDGFRQEFERLWRTY